MDQAPILKLNDDCLLEIFSYLNLLDVINIEKSHPRFQDPAFLYYKQKTELDITKLFDVCEGINVEMMKEIGEKVGPHLRSLKIIGVIKRNGSDFLPLLAKCNNLQYLVLIRLDLRGCGAALKTIFVTLKSVLIRLCEMTEEFKECFRSAKTLETLNIDWHPNIGLSEIKNLISMEFSPWPWNLHNNFEPLDFIRFCRNNQGLKFLRIIDRVGSAGMNRQCFEAINNLKNLETLALHMMVPNQNYNDHINSIVDLPKLKHLGLRLTSETETLDILTFLENLKNYPLETLIVTDNYLNQLLEVLPYFRMLKIFAVFHETGNFRGEILDKLKCQETLEVLSVGEMQVTNREIYNFLKNCPRIKEIDLICCRRITNDLFKLLLPCLKKLPQNIKIRTGGTRVDVASIRQELLESGNKNIKIVVDEFSGFR